MRSLTLIFIILSYSFNFSQKIDIIPQLKKIESGKYEEAKEDLLELKKLYPNYPDIIFLDAVLTEDGELSRNYYELIYNNFPKSRFADAALFRNFSYYYALGLYKRAEELKERISKDYPKSAYLKSTEREFPDVDEMILVDPTPYTIKDHDTIKFTVQAGAFSNFKNANDLKTRFLNDGLISQISPKTVNNIQLHIVTVGNFDSRSDADNFLSDLEKNYSLKGRIIELD